MLRRQFLSTTLGTPLVAALSQARIDEAEALISRRINSGEVEHAVLRAAG